LLSVADDPHLIVADLVYHIEVHELVDICFADSELSMRTVESSIQARRVLPAGGPRATYWITVARDNEALRSEFLEPNCLFREVVEMDASWSDDLWKSAVMAMCTVRIVVNGWSISSRSDPPAGSEVSGNDRIVRWYYSGEDFSRYANSDSRLNMTISLDYHISSEVRRFHVALSAFYVMGGARVSFRLYDRDDAYTLDYEVFLSQALGKAATVSLVTKTALCKEMTVFTTDESLIWPGSGLIVSWRRRGHE
jgi:hypothetical protein